ncbi:MAG: element excision factor XisH family protein [Nostoc sp.]
MEITACRFAMPAKDLYHDTVVQALIKDGWEITDDPLLLSYGGRELYVDLGIEKRAIAAQKDDQKIAVEIKSFLKPSPVRDLEEAVGQYGVYQSILTEIAPERILYLAVPRRSYETIFTEKLGQLIIKRLQIKLLVFDEEQVRIVQWIP